MWPLLISGVITAYLRFFVNSEGVKYFKSYIASGYDPEEFNSNARVVENFSANPDTQEIRYVIDHGNVRTSAVTSMKKFTFIPDD